MEGLEPIEIPISSVHHRTCGTMVTWRFGTAEKSGGPYCGECKQEVPANELKTERPICLTF